MFCEKIVGYFPIHKKEIKRLSQEKEELRLKNTMLSYQQDQYKELLETYEDLVKAYEAKIQELRNVIKDMKCEWIILTTKRQM